FSKNKNKLDQIKEARVLMGKMMSQLALIDVDHANVSLKHAFLQMENQLADKLRLILGKDQLGVEWLQKYALEGLVGTYGSIPKPSGDQFEGDHQPGAGILRHAAAMKVPGTSKLLFAKRKIRDVVGGTRVDGGWVINLHKSRHVKG